MSNVNNLSGLFNPKSVVEAPVARNNDEYKVSFKDGKAGIYESVVRFIPFFANPEKSIMQKQVSYVKNPVTQQGMYVDDPRTVGQFSPVIDMFFKLYNSGNAQFKEFGKNHLSTKTQYASLVQIMQDTQHPELVGKIKVFKYGKKVWDKLYNEEQEHPAMGQGINPFNPIEGRYFYIKCVSSAGFNNFDQSYFFDNKQGSQILPSGFWYTNAAGQMEAVTAQSDQQAVYDYLAVNSPDLGKYDYSPWTSDQQKFVDETLALIAGYMQSGTLQTNLSTLNTPSAPTAGLQVNASPVFPGATVVPPAPVVESAPSAPVSSNFGMPSVTPAVPPVAPSPAATPAQGTPIMPGLGGLSMGQSSLGGNIPQPGVPNISGIEIPNVQPATVAQPTVGGIGGNIDDIIANL